MVPLGVETRTSETFRPFGEVRNACPLCAWRRGEGRCALAGDQLWPLWPGAVRHVQSRKG